MKKVKYLFVLVTVLLGIFLEIKLLDLFYADVYLKQGREQLADGQYSLAVTSFDLAISKNPNESFYYRNRSQAYAEVAALMETSADKNFFKRMALEDVIFAYRLNSKNLRVIRNSIPIYYLLSLNEPAESDLTVITKNYLASVKQTYPKDLGVLVDVALYEKKLGWLGDYANTFTSIQNLRPDVATWYPALLPETTSQPEAPSQ